MANLIVLRLDNEMIGLFYIDVFCKKNEVAKMQDPINKEDVQPVRMADGISRRTLVYNDTVMICYFRFRNDARIPLHNHEAHQIGYVLSGKIKFIRRWQAFPAAAGCKRLCVLRNLLFIGVLYKIYPPHSVTYHNK